MSASKITEFEIDPLIVELAQGKRRSTYGIMVCGLFHKPKVPSLALFYTKLVANFEAALNEKEKQSVYICPMEYLHITIVDLHNFKTPSPSSIPTSLLHWKQRFLELKNKWKDIKTPILLSIDEIRLSSAAGFIQFKHDAAAGGIDLIRSTLKEICRPDKDAVLYIPNIVHMTFLRFKAPVTNFSVFC